MYMGHDHSSPGIEGERSGSNSKSQGQKLKCSSATLPQLWMTMGRIWRYGGLGPQVEMQLVIPRSSIEDNFLVTYESQLTRRVHPGPWKYFNLNAAKWRPLKYLKMKAVLVSPGKHLVWYKKFYCIIWRLTSATVNFCNIAIQLITYWRLDSRIATAIL